MAFGEKPRQGLRSLPGHQITCDARIKRCLGRNVRYTEHRECIGEISVVVIGHGSFGKIWNRDFRQTRACCQVEFPLVRAWLLHSLDTANAAALLAKSRISRVVGSGETQHILHQLEVTVCCETIRQNLSVAYSPAQLSHSVRRHQSKIPESVGEQTTNENALDSSRFSN